MNGGRSTLIAGMLLLCSSCAFFAPENRALPADLPSRFSLYPAGEFDSANNWWTCFRDSELDQLVHEAVTESPSIHQAWARLAQAEAVAKKAGASRLPSLTAEGERRAARNSLTYTTDENYSLGLNTSFELDLWGRVRSEAEAAALDREASREQLYTVAITLASETALRWAGLIAQQQQIKLLRQQLETNETSLELVELRFRSAQATALDVYQQRQVVARTKALIPMAEKQVEILQNELAVLLGRSDFPSVKPEASELPEIDRIPDVGIIADVLANRPDVRRAGLMLQAADWRVSAARAARLPAIRLNGSGEYANTDFSDLFNDWYANLIASVTGPVFEGGRLNAEVKRTQAVVDERLALYRETVLGAIKEVENAIISDRKQQEYVYAVEDRLVAARLSYEESVNRYRNGAVEYTTVLIQLSALQTLEREFITAHYDLFRYRVDLCRALGGTWPEQLKEEGNRISINDALKGDV